MEERQIGSNIRALRTSAGLTVAALATKAGVTKSTISKIETGKISTPISTLVRVASGLNVPLARLFLEPQIDPAYVLTRAGKGTQITRDGSKFGYSYAALALAMRQKPIEPFVLSIEPSDPIGKFQHGGQEFIFMLSGTLEITVGGETLRLDRGDSLYFDPTLVHTTRAIGKSVAKFLCVFVLDPLTPAVPVPKTQQWRKHGGD